MASLVKDLVEAGIHFGHRSTNWNPKMEPYIFGKRNKIHVIDVKSTIKGLLLARKFLTKKVSEGKDVLFVGTKRQARECIKRYVSETDMHYVTERWLGGTLTNFRTIRERLKRLEELESLEETGQIDQYSKKMESQLRREREKIEQNLGGIRNMNSLPGVMVVIDANHELNALKEARKLGSPTVCLIDTDSDPSYADIPIPGNDDSIRAIDAIVKSLCAAVQEGKNARSAEVASQAKKRKEDAEKKSPAPKSKRRSGRAQWRADEGSGVKTDETPDAGEKAESEADEPTPPETPESTTDAEGSAAEPTKMGPAAEEGDTSKAVTSAVGQDDDKPADQKAPPASTE
ncbi:MAG: 30S ribosomal protein S2 [Phycisphaeraceae bacterium]|nr:30S ribosomal protein S2 [Phycisphaeraceae bacterium]